MARAIGSFLRKNKGPQWVIQKHENGGLVYYCGGGAWSEHPLDAKLYRPDGNCSILPQIGEPPEGIVGQDWDLVRIS